MTCFCDIRSNRHACHNTTATVPIDTTTATTPRASRAKPSPRIFSSRSSIAVLMPLGFLFVSDLHLCLFGVEDMQRVMIATSSFVLFRQINRARTCIPHPNRHSLLHWIQKPKTKVWAKLDMQNSKTSLDVTHRPLSSALSAVPPHVTAAFIPNHSYHALGKTTRKRQHRIFPSAIIFIYCGKNPLPFTFCQETYVFPQHMYSHYF